MSLKVDKVQLEIIMKSDTARAEIIKLEDQAKILLKEMKKLKNNPEELAKASAEYDKVKAKISELRKTIGLTGMTMRELQQRQKELNMMMRNMDPRTEKYTELRKELTEVNMRMRELRGTAGKTEGLFSKAANGFNKYFALIGGFLASITGLSMTFRKLSEDVAHMDDVYSDVMKTTGMTRDEVLLLNEEFKKMDTRTTRESLNNLARDAGKLGIEGSKKILDFVDAGNQINVALGEDLGEGAIQAVGKMVGVFDKSTKHLQGLDLKGQMLAVGSAINELGASSSANEGYLVQFAGRLGGVASQAGIAIDQILGYASALDQDMQQVEMSATALQNFIMKIMGEPAKFAKMAGMEVTQFTTLLKTDANEAIKTVLRSLNAQGGFQQLIPIFKDMGLDGARAVGVLSSMASSIDKIDEAQKIANKALVEGTSLTDEYTIKNENLQARLDKARKAFKEKAFELGQSLNPALLKSTNATTYLIKALIELPKWLNANKVLLITLAAVWTANTIAVNASIISDKLKVFWTDKVTVSIKKMTAAIKANPWGLIVTGVVLGIAWLNKYLNKQDEVNKSQERFLDLAQRTSDFFAQQQNLQQRFDARGSLSKTQLESLSSDIDSQISELEKIDAEIKTKSKNLLDNDAELKRLQAEYAKGDKFTQMNLLAKIGWRENELIGAYAVEFNKTNKMLKELKKNKTEVDTLIATRPTNTTIPDNEDKKKKKEQDPFDIELKQLEEANRIREIHWRNRISDEKELESILLENQINFLDEKLDLEKEYGKSTTQTQLDILAVELKQEKDADEHLLSMLKIANKAKLDSLAELDGHERDLLQDKVDSGEITNSQYNARLATIELTSARARLETAKFYLQQIKDAEFANASEKEKAVKEATKTVEDATKDEQNAVTRSNRAKIKSEQEYKREREDLLRQYGLLSLRSQYDLELVELQKSLNKKLVTEEEYAKAVQQLKLKYVEKGAQDAVDLANYVAEAVSAYHQLEADSLESEKQRELEAAGDNAEKREQIELDYAQKELDLKKKQANADAGIKIAQTVAAGALAAIQAFGQLGPIGGAIAAALIATTTAFQVASIIKQRNAIMATTLNTNSSDSKVNDTGSRVANSQLPTTPQAAKGRWDVIGEEDGRTYRNIPYRGIARTGYVKTPTLMAERGDELIIDNPTLRNIRMNAPHLLTAVMRHRVPQRASGKWDTENYYSSGEDTRDKAIQLVINDNTVTMKEVASLLKWLKENGIHAYTVLSEFEKAQALRDKSLKLGSLK